MANSRAQDVAAEIKAEQIALSKAIQAYNRGGSLEEVNRCNRRLADCHQKLYRVDAGLARDDR